jgi:hypothetical protein
MGVIGHRNGYVYTTYIHMTDRELLIEAFELLYTIYRNQHGTRYGREISVYPTLSKIKNRLEETIDSGYSPAEERKKANGQWT